MPKNKLTRKELLKEPDKFITFTGKMIQFVLEHKKTITIVSNVILSIILIITLYQYISERNLNQAYSSLHKLIEKYQTSVKNSNPEKALSEVLDDFQKLIDSNSRNAAGKYAKLVFANICYDGKNYDKAIELYNQLLVDYAQTSSNKNTIINGLAYSYAQKKDIQNAIKYFEMIANGTDPVFKDDALFQLGRLYAMTDQKEKSKEMYHKIASDYPSFVYNDLVKEKVAE